MGVLRVEKNTNFVVMDKTALRDSRLSWKAKGIMAYMLSMPDDWKFYVDELITHSPDGETSFRSGLRELKDNGYVERNPIRDEQNKIIEWETVVHEVPLGDSPLDGKPLDGNLHVENHALLNNKELNNKELSNDIMPGEENNTILWTSKLMDFWDKNGFGHSTHPKQKLLEFLDDKEFNEPGPILLKCLEICTERNKRNYKYAETILRNWIRDGYKTVAEIEAAEQEFQENRQQRSGRQPIDWDNI